MTEPFELGSGASAREFKTPGAFGIYRLEEAKGLFSLVHGCRGHILATMTGLVRSEGYSVSMSLETCWRGAGTEEESSGQSFAGMKELPGKAGAL